MKSFRNPCRIGDFEEYNRNHNHNRYVMLLLNSAMIVSLTLEGFGLLAS